MAKATLDDGRPLLILGLERGNIERLQKGQPIKRDLATVGMVGECLIFFGETVESMAAHLEAHGFIIGAGGVQ